MLLVVALLALALLRGSLFVLTSCALADRALVDTLVGKDAMSKRRSCRW